MLTREVSLLTFLKATTTSSTDWLSPSKLSHKFADIWSCDSFLAFANALELCFTTLCRPAKPYDSKLLKRNFVVMMQEREGRREGARLRSEIDNASISVLLDRPLTIYR